MKNQKSKPSFNSITYRNAIYEGKIDPITETRNDFGIIYMAKSHQLVACNNWHHDSLEGESLFFNDDKKYIYGTWIRNLPQGFNVFRFQETILMTEFYRGRLIKNTRILIIFEKYNIGAILIVSNQPQNLDDLQVQISTKKQVFSSQDIKEMFQQCKWPSEYFSHNQTLIKYVSSKLTESQKTNVQNNCKLRLVDNRYYRFGYDDGLAIIFDEEFNRVSVGSHFKSKLKSFGIAFNRHEQIARPAKGKIVKIQSQKTLFKSPFKNQQQMQNQKTNQDLNKMMKAKLLVGVNFCNKFYKNPSKIFEYYMMNIINQTSIRNIIAGSLTSRKLYEQSLQFSRIEKVANNSTQILLNQYDTQKLQQQQFQEEKAQKISLKLNKEKIMQDRLRLETIRKQIYDSLDKKKQKIQKEIMKQHYQRDIINREIVGKGHYETPERTLDKSRSRKKIFEESQKNLKILKQLTPTRSQPNLSPFKTKMKSRIFYGDSNQISVQMPYNPSQIISRKKNNKNAFREQSGQTSNNRAVIREYKNFSSGHSSKNNFSRGLSKSKDQKNKGNSQIRQQQEQSSKQYHVTFQNQKQFDKISNYTSKKYPSEGGSKKYPSQNGRTHQYVPINLNQVRQKKKNSNIFSSVEDESSEYRKSQNKHNLTKSKEKIDGNKNKEKQFSIKQKQKITPKSKYYMQKSESEEFHHRMSGQRSNENIKIQKQMSKRQFMKQISKENTFEEFQITLQDSNNVYKGDRNLKKTQNQRQKLSTQKIIYNDDTFKQSPSREDHDQHNQSRHSGFKYSNQVYLDKYNQKISTTKRNDTSSKKSKQSAYMIPQNNNVSQREEVRKKTKQNGSSYMQKHKIKKSVQKQIEKSPDKTRCYGKKNNPYIQKSPNYNKNMHIQNSFGPNDLQYFQTQMNYEDSSYRITRKQIVEPNSSYPSKMF